MDRKKVERARDYLRELVSKGKLDALTLGHVSLVSRLLTTALDDQSESDPGDECECDGCKTTEPAPHEEAGVGNDCNVVDGGYEGHAPVRAMQFTFHADQPSDYEIRLKAWNIAYDFMWEALDNEFDATLNAAKKLYSFLSGKNEDAR